MKSKIFWVALTTLLVVGASAGALRAQIVDPATGNSYQRVFVGSGFSWHAARDSALALGGHLATVRSQSEQDFVSQLLPSFPTSEVVFLGGTDESSEGQWRWVTGETWGYTNWLAGQPDNSQGVQHFLIGYAQGWDDSDVSYSGPSFIVEWESDHVLHVPSEYATIQAGINAAVNGDTVLVAPGTYAEQIDFSGKGIAVVSEQGALQTTIAGPVAGGWLVSFQHGEGRGSVLSGFKLYGATSYAIIINASSPTIRDNIIDSNLASVTMSASAAAITDNEFSHNNGGFYGFYVTGFPLADSAEIRHNRFVNNNAAIDVSYAARVSFSGNLCEHNSEYAVYFSGSVYGASIENNTLFSNGGGIAIGSEVTGIVRNNIVSFNGGFGIWSTSGVSLSHNNVYANSSGNYYGVLPVPGSISADPLFCDTGVQDFHLTLVSPCVGAGEGGTDIGSFGVGCAAPPFAVLGIQVGAPLEAMDHVIGHTPRITWRWVDAGHQPLIGSALQVGTDNDWALAEMWNEPLIPAPDTEIVYGGLPLSDGAVYFVRVRVLTDSAWSPWKSVFFRLNTPPTAPTLNSPISEQVSGHHPILNVTGATDEQGDVLAYEYQVYRDSDLTIPAGGATSYPGTEWSVDSVVDENGLRWWRCRAFDGYGNGPWSGRGYFWVNDIESSPSAVSLRSPGYYSDIPDSTPEFIWNAASDPDPYDTLSYTLTLATDAALVFHSDVNGLTTTHFVWPSNLSFNARYWWRVSVTDRRGASSVSPVWSFTVCSCPCHADPTCDGSTDVIDVVKVLDRAFRGAAASTDPNCTTYGSDVDGRTDVDCSSSTDIVDVVKMVNVAFRGQDPFTQFCSPCAP